MQKEDIRIRDTETKRILQNYITYFELQLYEDAKTRRNYNNSKLWKCIRQVKRKTIKNRI